MKLLGPLFMISPTMLESPENFRHHQKGHIFLRTLPAYNCHLSTPTTGQTFTTLRLIRNYFSQGFFKTFTLYCCCFCCCCWSKCITINRRLFLFWLFAATVVGLGSYWWWCCGRNCRSSSKCCCWVCC